MTPAATWSLSRSRTVPRTCVTRSRQARRSARWPSAWARAAWRRCARERPHFFTGLSGVSGGRVVPVPGGVLVRDADGGIIGAVGISGDTSDNDEAAAIAGIEAAGFQADGG